MFEDLNTKVHSVRELVAWLDEHRAATNAGEHAPAGAPPIRDAFDPEATGIMQAPELDRMLAREQARASEPDPASVSGSLEAFHVVELLQALSSGDRTGVLELSDGQHFVRVHLDKGRIQAATFDDAIDVEPLEALKRAAAMRQGDFRFGPDTYGPAPGSLVSLSTVQVLIELSTVAWQMSAEDEHTVSADFNLDAFDETHLGASPFDEPHTTVGSQEPITPAPVDLPPVALLGGRPLSLPDPLLPRLRDLTPDELDVLQAVLRYKTLDRTAAVLGEGTSVRDVVRRLIARGYLAG